MSARHLAIVATPVEIDRASERLADRIRDLQAEARDLAHGHIGLLSQALGEVSRLAGEIAEGGEAYPVGARELSRRLAQDAAAQSQTLNAITDRRP